MGETARALGKGQATIEHKGVTYRLSELGYDGVAAVECWAEEEAIKTARRMKRILPTDEGNAFWEETVRQINTKTFTHGTKELAAIAQSKAGIIETLRLSMLPNHPEVADGRIPTEIVNEKMEEARDAMNMANTDPNSAAPETPGTTGQSQSSSPTSPESPGTSDPGKSAA